MYRAKVSKDKSGKWLVERMTDIVADPVTATVREGMTLLGLIQLHLEDGHPERAMEVVNEGYDNLQEIRKLYQKLNGN